MHVAAGALRVCWCPDPSRTRLGVALVAGCRGAGLMCFGWRAADKPPGALASSFLWCELMQPVDLAAALSERGFTAGEAGALLDAAPPLQFSICYGARADCRAECEVSRLRRPRCSRSPNSSTALRCLPCVSCMPMCCRSLDVTGAADHLSMFVC